MKIIKLVTFSLLLFLLVSCAEETDSPWQEIKVSNAPEARYDTCSFYNPASKSIYIIGGRSSQNKKFNDVWVFDIRNKKWVKLSPAGTIDKGGRMNYCIYDEKNNLVYLYGRNAGGNSLPSNIVKYDLINNKFTEIAPSNLPDTSLRGHSVILLKSGLQEPSLVIFGGEDAGNTINNDIRVFSILSKTFTKLEISGEKPKERIFHTAILTPNNKMLVIGGKSTSGTLNDMWEFDFNTKKWKKLSDNIPLNAYYTSYFYDKNRNKIFFYGGKKDDEILSKFMSYDLKTQKWETIDQNPKPKKLSGSAVNADDDYIYIFSGNYINDKNESVSTNKLFRYTIQK